MNSGTGELLEQVHVFDPSAIYAVHESGPSFGDGATWQLQPFEIDGQHLRVSSLDGIAPDDLFVSGVTTGGISTLSHYDGTTFTPLPTGRAARLLAVGPREVLAAHGSTADIYVLRFFVP
jgi:hypothetical protein